MVKVAKLNKFNKLPMTAKQFLIQANFDEIKPSKQRNQKWLRLYEPYTVVLKIALHSSSETQIRCFDLQSETSW